MSRYCLDTSAYSQFKRGQPELVSLIESAEWIGMPAIVLGELFAGFRAGSRFERNNLELDQFVDNPIVHILPVERNVAGIFGEIFAELRATGAPIPTNDLWIAATCAIHAATLITLDTHFTRIPRIGVKLLA